MQISIQIMQSEKLGKKGYPVKLVATNKGKTKRKLLFHAFPDQWDFRKNQPNVKHPEYNLILPELLTWKSNFFEAEKMDDVDEALGFILNEVFGSNRAAKMKTFQQFGLMVLKELEMQRQLGNLRVYKTALVQFGRFIPDVEFEDLTTELLLPYKTYLSSKNINAGKLGRNGKELPERYLKKNSIHQYLRTLQAIYNAAVLRGYAEDNPIFKGVYKNITVKLNRTQKKFLSIESLRVLENNDLNGRPKVSTDLFLLMFYLGGQNFKDLYYLKSRQVMNDRIYFRRGKLNEGGYEFDVRLFPKARAILEKYGDLGNEYVFPWDKDFTRFLTFKRNFLTGLYNAQTKLGIEILPTGGKLGINVARHTFSTLGVQRGVNREIKALLMGHEIGDVQSVYEDYPKDMRDAEHWKIISLE